MQALDPLLHNQLRLAIMALLSQFEHCTFNFLLDKTQATRGNLSVQITTLEQAGYIVVIKSFKEKKPQTVCELTDKGRQAMFAYTQALKDYLNM